MTARALTAVAAAGLAVGRRVAAASTSLALLAARIGRDGAEGRLQAAAVERSRRDIVTWVSHDLHTSLAAIRTMAEGLEGGLVDDPPTLARYHHAMRTEIERVAALVDDLAELSRVDAGGSTPGLDLEPAPPDALVANARGVFDLAYRDLVIGVPLSSNGHGGS